jgi:hypothetical protein
MLATDAHWLGLDLPLARMVRGLASPSQLPPCFIPCVVGSRETSRGAALALWGPC